VQSVQRVEVEVLDDAVAQVSVGDLERNQELNAAEQAAWTQVASVVLASDLAITLY
jgi:hypothetical protein